ncbi:MAG: phosphoglucomutase, alpha-D-glucose phosphate-specific, partial [Deinococcales bacterium]
MSPHPLAGEPAPRDLLVDVPRLVASYYTLHPDPSRAEQRVSFGTSGHRGTSGDGSFNEDHILAVAQAVSEYRAHQGVDGPLVVGADTHALSESALRTALEALVANGVHVVVAQDFAPVPTPVVSHAVLTHNARKGAPRADGIVITPSHNPPADGGFKYNPPHGGPAGTDATGWIQQRANELLEAELRGVKRVRFERAAAAAERRALVTP